MIKVAIGQDSHRFANPPEQSSKCPAGEQSRDKACVLGGVPFETAPAFDANSDGDVVLHAVTNAVSGITCRNILGSVADQMCRSGITDSREYLKVAMADLAAMGCHPVHLSITIEAARPKIAPKVEEMRETIGALMGLTAGSVGITATTGEGLTSFGQGLGVSVFAVLTAEQEER